MKKIIKITAVLMAVIMMAAFTDVPKKHWAYSVINQAQQDGITNGVTEKLFEPDRNISKQEIALMLYRVHAKLSSAEDISSYAQNYAMDIETAGIAAWAAPELAYGFEKNYWMVNDFQGDGSGLASRELISRWACSIDTDVFRDCALRVLPYKDVSDIDAAYYGYVNTMYVHGIMQGTGEGMFSAKKSISRAEAAAVTVRTLNTLDGTSLYIQQHPVRYQYGVISCVDTKSESFYSGETFINIKSDAKIILDGNAASFEELKALEGKKASVSQYLLGNNINAVWIQSGPVVLSGILENYYSAAAVDGVDAYEVISINVDGISTDFIKNTSTEVLGTLTPGNTVQFITDGVYLQEIK